MNKQALFFKSQRFFIIFCAIAALLTLLDYRFSKETVSETITATTRSLENKYNAGRNYYYGYYIKTPNGDVVVSREFQKNISIGQVIAIKKSLVFNEVNQVINVASGMSEVYSLRIASGLILPSLVLVILAIGYRLQNRVGTLVFVAQMVLLINLIFLLL